MAFNRGLFSRKSIRLDSRGLFMKQLCRDKVCELPFAFSLGKFNN